MREVCDLILEAQRRSHHEAAMNWRWISLAALLGALVIGYGALIEHNPAPAASSGQAERPGYYLQDAIITQTQQDGSVSIRLVANASSSSVNDSIRWTPCG